MKATGEQMLKFLKNSYLMEQMAAQPDGRRELRLWAEQLENVRRLNQQKVDEATEGLSLIRVALKEVAA